MLLDLWCRVELRPGLVLTSMRCDGVCALFDDLRGQRSLQYCSICSLFEVVWHRYLCLHFTRIFCAIFTSISQIHRLGRYLYIFCLKVNSLQSEVRLHSVCSICVAKLSSISVSIRNACRIGVILHSYLPIFTFSQWWHLYGFFHLVAASRM